jgi:hypothetical protein
MISGTNNLCKHLLPSSLQGQGTHAGLPAKRSQAAHASADLIASTDAVAVKMEELQLRHPGALSVSNSRRGLTVRNVRECGRVCPPGFVEDRADIEFANNFDWDGDMKLWQQTKSKPAVSSPISAIFGQLVNCLGPCQLSGLKLLI